MNVIILLSSVVALIILAASLVVATNGIDISSPLSVSTLNCAKSNGIEFVISRAYRSYGGIDPNIGEMMSNCRAAGLSCSAYVFPCRGVAPSKIANAVSSAVSGSTYIWLDLEHNPSQGCDWGQSSPAGNCQYLSELINAFKSKFSNVGIYTSAAEHNPIFGGDCTAGSDLPLWWPHYSGGKSFSDFSSFGGWSAPSIKQYWDSTSVCGIGQDGDANWYPGGPSPPSPPGPPPPPSPSGSCNIFYSDLCVGPSNCMCDIGESCGGKDAKETGGGCKGNITRARNAAGGCSGTCRWVTHDACPGGNNCLKAGAPCN